jgi:hypothetical protein
MPQCGGLRDGPAGQGPRTLERNVLRGAGLAQIDPALARTVAVTEP